MTKTTKDDWLIAGSRILMRYGARELTIEALCNEVGLTKGSFYHHFKGIDDYIDRFLIFFEDEGTLQIMDQVNQEASPAARIRKLIEIATHYPPQLEVAMRAWALQDDIVRHVYERIDQQRIAYVADLWRQLVGDEQAIVLAHMMYSILIGGEHLLPPLDRSQHRAVFELYLDQFLPPTQTDNISQPQGALTLK